MSYIVYRKNKKNGAIYAYRQESYRDPVTRKPRNTRTYLGRFDPETNTIIQKTERRNSKENSGADGHNVSQETVRLQALLTHRDEQIRTLKEKITEQGKQIRALRHSIERIKEITLSVSSIDYEDSNQSEEPKNLF